MTTETALVGPLPSVRFHDGTILAADPPTDTLDPRWKACTDHRTACDCREAELNEDRSEYRAMLRAVIDVAASVLAGHPTHNFNRNMDDSIRDTGCMCTGCQIVRAAYLPLTHAGIAMPRRSQFVPAVDRRGRELWLNKSKDARCLLVGRAPDGWRRLYVEADGDAT